MLWTFELFCEFTGQQLLEARHPTAPLALTALSRKFQKTILFSINRFNLNHTLSATASNLSIYRFKTKSQQHGEMAVKPLRPGVPIYQRQFQCPHSDVRRNNKSNTKAKRSHMIYGQNSGHKDEDVGGSASVGPMAKDLRQVGCQKSLTKPFLVFMLRNHCIGHPLL